MTNVTLSNQRKPRKTGRLMNTGERKAFLESKKGSEPEVSPLRYTYSLADFFNFHNFATELPEIAGWAKKYVKTLKDPVKISAINAAQDYELRTLGILIRANNTTFLEEYHISRIGKIIDSLVIKYGGAPDNTTIFKPSLISIADRAKNLADLYIGEIDGAIDDFLTEGTEFSMKGFVSKNSISSVVSNHIGSYYESGLLQELILARDGKDDDLMEGYSHLSKIQLRKYISLIESIVNECKQRVVSVKSERKPRARKQKPAIQLVAKMKYMKSFEKLGLVSEEPKKIVGAKEVWFYDGERRKLVCYHALDASGLGVKGTTIIGFDVSKSGVKNIRKPEVFFKDRNKFTRKEMETAWKNIVGKTSTVNGRTNDRQVILGVY